MLRIALAFAFLATTAQAQWTILDSHSTASFRGVDSVGKGIVWVSGTDGTVLRSEDAGYLWQRCTVPPGAEHLDFRGIQAFDANTAIVMSSGKGDLSRLYKTTDGCQTWKLVFTNPDKDGFWDALVFQDIEKRYSPKSAYGMLLGDPVHGMFYLALTMDSGEHWIEQHNKGLRANAGQEGAFAASNSSLLLEHAQPMFGTGGIGGAFLYTDISTTICLDNCPDTAFEGRHDTWKKISISLGDHTEGSGIFSLAEGPSLPPLAKGLGPQSPNLIVAVGGDYQKPEDIKGTAAFTLDRGQHWRDATIPPHGYRSAVAYDAPTKTWITVGPNGTDISTDDGKNWRALKPGPNDAPDADQHWNALSLPFVVGPHGRIGVLNAEAVNSGR